MNEHPNVGADGHREDANYGMFQPVRRPAYATWTQFSGMPQTPTAEDPSTFDWGSFVTPPNTPADAGQNDMTNPNYFTELNIMMNAMGKNSVGNFDASSQDTDIASTPVAQSLLEALRSTNPMMTPVPDPTVPMQNTMNFETAGQDGYDMYAEALKKMGEEYNQTYSQFSPPADMLNTSPSVSPLPKDWDHYGSTSNLKPSYSDVAKTLKSNQGSGKEKDETDLSKRRSGDSQTSKSFKGSKNFVPRHIRGRKNSVPDVMRPTVSPDSKYGLDDFGDVSKDKGEPEKEGSVSGLDHIPLLARRNSTSSMSSGTSGIEEIHIPKSCNTFSNVTGEAPKYEKISNKEKERTLDDTGKNDGAKTQKAFFDARRIFQTKDTNKRRSQSSQSKVVDEDAEPMILNNGKPSYSAWCSHKKTTHYINNNLRDTQQKRTNQNPGASGKDQVPAENVFPQGAAGRAEKRAKTSSTAKSSSSSKPKMPLQTSFDHELIDEWLSFLYNKAKHCLNSLWTLMLMVIIFLFSIIVPYLVSGCVQIINWIWGKLWSSRRWRKAALEIPKKIGLEENISLPSTGEQAMQRLLGCKGKDPYSILGLKASTSDENIKKYYRRQAFLVHPDKNQQPGAEEAFKILGHAFELIGDVSKRQAYDRQLQEAEEAKAAMHEFNDLLTKFQEKIHQDNNMMPCEHCGGKHKRTPIERPLYCARNCQRCNIRHSAKEGDVWAEASMLGFLWHYYARMEGKVYDITEWAACMVAHNKDYFKEMQADAHHVFFRIRTLGNRGNHRRHNPNNTNFEADLEDIISHLFHEAMYGEGDAGAASNGQARNTNAEGSGAAPTGKRHKKKKRKH